MSSLAGTDPAVLSSERPSRWAATVVLAPASAALAAAASLRAGDGTALVMAALVTAWAAGGAVVVLRRPREPLGTVVLGGTLIAAVATAGLPLRPCAIALLPAAGMHLMLALPDGRLPRGWGVPVILAYLLGAGVGVPVALRGEDLAPALIVAEAAPAAVVAWFGSTRRYWQVEGHLRHRMQWFGSAVTIAVTAALVAVAARILVGWPSHESEIAAAATAPIPLALVLGTTRRGSRRIERVLAVAISAAGLCLVVVAVYLAVLLGLGRVPTESERGLLLLSMIAAGICALLYGPARAGLARFAERRIYGDRHEHRSELSSFGNRLSRAIPLDELLLQLAEALHQSLRLTTAEVWTGTEGTLVRAASVPDLPPARLTISASEQPVVVRAGVMGPAWMRVWLPRLLEGRPEGAAIRVTPIASAGALLGLIAVERAADEGGFDEAEEQRIAELARQMGVALRNVELDSALRTSLDEVRRQAEELQASRQRIVAAADAERRKLERNLHDGAQQRLVALAVNLRLAQKAAGSDGARAAAMLADLSDDLKDAVQELRALAHGIYPPLLMDRGLAEALSATAARASLPTVVDASGLGRYPQEMEAAAYFCCLEAMQNAAKHAGEAATVRATLREQEGGLLFEVADDGPGFDPERVSGGAGFVNMRDRLGAIGGTLTIDSTPGAGARIAGRIPLPAAAG